MRRFLMNFLRVFRFPLLLTTATLPVTMALIHYLEPLMLPFAWVLPLCYLALDLLGTRVRGKWRVPYSLFSVAIFLALGLYAVKITLCMPLLSVPGCMRFYLSAAWRHLPSGGMSGSRLRGIMRES